MSTEIKFMFVFVFGCSILLFPLAMHQDAICNAARHAEPSTDVVGLGTNRLPPGYTMQVNNFGQYAYVDEDGWRSWVPDTNLVAEVARAWDLYNAYQRKRDTTWVEVK